MYVFYVFIQLLRKTLQYLQVRLRKQFPVRSMQPYLMFLKCKATFINRLVVYNHTRWIVRSRRIKQLLIFFGYV